MGNQLTSTLQALALKSYLTPTTNLTNFEPKGERGGVNEVCNSSERKWQGGE
jgi:hypothetical protein